MSFKPSIWLWCCPQCGWWQRNPGLCESMCGEQTEKVEYVLPDDTVKLP